MTTAPRSIRQPAYRRHVEYVVSAVDLADGTALELAAFPTRAEARGLQARISHDGRGHVTRYVGRIERVSS